MFLKSIHLNNVKCFSDIALSFEEENGDIRKRTLLLAENSMGKSTLLKAIALATGGSDAIADLLGEPSDWIRHKTQGCEILVVLATTEGKEREIRLRIAPKDTRADVIVKNKQSLAWLDDALNRKKRDYFVLGFGASRRLNTVNRRRTNTSVFTNKRAQSVATLFDPDAATTPLDSWVMDLDYLENRTGLETVRKVLSNLLPEIKFHRIDKPSGHLLFDTPDGIVPLHCLSDGYLAMAAWMGDLLFRVFENFDDLKEQPLTAKGLLLIDEVDLHLHPKRQRELFAFLDEWLPNFQFVATTHSSMAAQQANEGELHCLTREARKIQIHPFSGNPKRLLLHQLVMSPAFGLDTDESKEIENLKNRYRHLRDKADLSSKEQEDLDKLTVFLNDLPTAGKSNMELSEGHEQLLRKLSENETSSVGKIIHALSVLKGSPIPWSLIVDAVNDARDKRLFEFIDGSPPWPCAAEEADRVGLKVSQATVKIAPKDLIGTDTKAAWVSENPTLGLIKETLESNIGVTIPDHVFLEAAKGAIGNGLIISDGSLPDDFYHIRVRQGAWVGHAESYLIETEIQDLAEAVADLADIAPELDFKFRISIIAEGEPPSKEVLEKIKAALQKVTDKLKFD